MKEKEYENMQEPKLIDIHCHLDFPDFNQDRDEVIKRTLDAGVWFINIGVDLETSQKSIELAEKYDGVWLAVGLHPTDRAGGEFDLEKYRELARHPKVVAIGECGLDYYRNQEARNPKSKIRNKQIKIFKQQIELALEVGKPLMIHCRDAHDEVLDIVSSFKLHASRLCGDIHFFSGTWEQAQKYLEMGFSLSFDGPITFSDNYDETIKNMPFDKIMAETDSPFAAPAPYRGKRNEPLYVKEVVKKIAAVRGVSFEEAAEQTTKNAINFFGLE